MTTTDDLVYSPIITREAREKAYAKSQEMMKEMCEDLVDVQPMDGCGAISPYIPLNIEVTKVEVTAPVRKLEGTWTVEFGTDLPAEIDEDLIGKIIEAARDEITTGKDMLAKAEPYDEQAVRDVISGAYDQRMLRDALRCLYEDTAEYITINNLGNIHHNKSMQMARDALAATDTQDKLDQENRDVWEQVAKTPWASQRLLCSYKTKFTDEEIVENERMWEEERGSSQKLVPNEIIDVLPLTDVGQIFTMRTRYAV